MAVMERERVRRKDGLALLFTPPFDKSPQDPGCIEGYPPGIRETGGQYTQRPSGRRWRWAFSLPVPPKMEPESRGPAFAACAVLCSVLRSGIGPLPAIHLELGHMNLEVQTLDRAAQRNG